MVKAYKSLPEGCKTGRRGGCTMDPMFRPPSLVLLCLVAALLSSAARAERIDFNRDIRPILSENCFYCHGQDGAKRKADLRLDVRESALEAKAIVPKDATASELVHRINADDKTRMPPTKSNRRLSVEQKKLL